MMKLFNSHNSLFSKSVKSLKYFSLILAAAMIPSCADDLEINDPDRNLPALEEGQILLNFNVVDPSIIHTRADQDKSSSEKEISSSCKHFAFVYQKVNNNYTLLQKQEISISNTTLSATLSLPASFDAENAKIVVVANVPNDDTEIGKFTNLSIGSNISMLYALTSAQLASNTQPASPFIMSGSAESASSQVYTVDLMSSAAKVSIEMANELEEFELVGYEMYNAPLAGFYTAAIATEDANKFQSGSQKYTASKIDNKLTNYTYPVKSLGSSTDIAAAGAGAYFIVEGKYKGETCYYRVDLRNGAEFSKTYYNIEANHWYQVEITDVYRKGYTSKEEAAKRYMGQEDDPAINVRIHDHAEGVLSMVTDGVRELGVTRAVSLTSTGGEFTVKVYSGVASLKATEEASSKIKVTIKEGSDWLEVGSSPTEITNASSETSGNQTGLQTGGVNDADNTGKRYKYSLSFKNDKIYSDKSATVEVEWCGMTRQLEVNYNADFKPEEACTAVLYYKAITANKSDSYNLSSVTNRRTQETNYWDFLKNTVKGIDQDAMADDKIRNEGLHFAMPYGDANSRWEYVYDLDFSKISSTSNPIKNISISTSNSTFFGVANMYAKYHDNTKLTLALKNPSESDYSYSTGTLSIHITYDNNEEVVLSMDIYHTGFFDYASAGTSNCLYYEVVGLDGNYWLDRNLGATSNKMFIDNADSDANGSAAAGGNYYKIYKKGSNYGDPSAQYTALCPPGYRVPNSTDWDKVRLSAKFTTSSITDDTGYYMTTYFATGDRRIGNVYFPKARFFNSDSEITTDNATKTPSDVEEAGGLSGNAGNGYYWTTSISSGLEKQEIGQWLQALNLSGGSNTYISGSIQKHLMSVRCIAIDSHASEEKNSINFNVKGATHVFLYTMDNATGQMSGLFTFPGKAIGSKSAVDKLDYNDDKSYLHFSYTSTLPTKDSNDEQVLFVFFAYVTDDGGITLITSNDATSVEEAIGWPVMVGYNYFFNKSFVPQPGGTNNEFPWPAAGTSGSNTSNKKYSGNKTVTLKWYKHPYGVNTDYDRVHVWFTNNYKPLGDFGANTQIGDVFDSTYYTKTFNINNKADSDSFSVIFHAGNSENQTDNISVGKTDKNTDQSTKTTGYTIEESGDNITITFGNYWKRDN